MRILLAAATLAAAILGGRSAAADEVTLAVGLSLAPYIIPENWSRPGTGSGMEYDIIREAMALEGHSLKPRLMPLARVAKELTVGTVDAATPMRRDSGVKACYSDVHVTYRNFAITLASRDLHIQSVADLAGKSVVAFQNASKYLGPDYAAMAARNPRYREEAKQVVQPLLLYLGRTDVVVADRNIFAWFAAAPEVTGRADTTRPVHFHPIFPPTEYHVAFRDQALCDSFNHGLARLKESGEYARIVNRYSRYLASDEGAR